MCPVAGDGKPLKVLVGTIKHVRHGSIGREDARRDFYERLEVPD